MTLLLDKYAKILCVSPFSKRWLNDEVAEARKVWARAKKTYGRDPRYDKDELKKARNIYYRVIRKAKQDCWQNFLQGQDATQRARSDDKSRFWTAFRYTKPQQFKKTPALKDTESHIATSMKAKEALVCKSAFPSPPKCGYSEPVIIPGVAHQTVTKDIIYEALMTQSTSKALGPDKINFQILCMVWDWDSERLIAMVQQAIKLGYRPKRWKRARGVLLEKGGRRDLSMVKSYRVISLLDCLGKVVEKIVAGLLSGYCENFSKLHQGQMGTRKQRCAIDAVASLVYKVEGFCAEKKLATALFMDVKGAFDHVSQTKLVERIIELGIDGDLIRWTQSFLTDRKVQLVIDGHTNKERDIETEIPQGSPVSPILFLVYISGVFEKVSESYPAITSLSFVVDLGFLASGHSVKELAKILGQVATVLDWGKSNAVTYDVAKTEAVLFSKSHRQRLNKQIAEVHINIEAEKIKFNKEATLWLGIWLDSQLKFTANVNEKSKEHAQSKSRSKD